MAGGHVLVVEGEDKTRLSLNLILRGQGFHVTEARSGFEAERQLLSPEPGAPPVNLILTEIETPGMDAPEMLGRLREAGVRIPVLVIAGCRHRRLVQELAQRGLMDHLDKPFGPDEVLRRVRQALASCA